MADAGIPAIVIGRPSQVMPKANGSKYVLIQCEVTKPGAEGLKVTATRTVLNKDGVVKDVPAVGEEVTLYQQSVPSMSHPGQFQHFFEISSGAQSASNEEISRLLGNAIRP